MSVRRFNLVVRSTMLSTWLGVSGVMGLMTDSWYGFAVPAVMLMLPMGFLLEATDRGTVTRAIPTHLDRTRVEAAIAMLVHATVRGVRPTERIALQRAIDDACEVLTAMCGTDPWIVAARNRTIQVPDHLASRRDLLATHAPALIDRVKEPNGAKVGYFEDALRPVVVLMAAIIRDFGLDPRGLAATERLLPGMAAEVERPVPAIAENVRRLATEWSSSVRLPETLDTMRADTAVRELDALEAAWEAARAVTTPEDQEAVDADFRKACDALAATISYSLSVHAATLRDDLSVQTRYIETKHGDAFGQVDA